ncbi:NifB/NifX family molybdenum-iron cluster-binding protein [Methanoplanus limicola]|uniref:Dinitrogenase iron-molybdenum cofactor biosynthesis protein n=1 Tax=Methanoplanus limicola DSM 2279 TaxID=937775 RepID=H1YXE1_9EURY|nr:NifB/NifX family molybdenum-iron cluster-binding protein [Methanoplanus limicola]EHQ36878.1 Dinitrogenase iron-molybdenum cofactor biosynthesis protein [Methanoplanus limicola DSM 2279]
MKKIAIAALGEGTFKDEVSPVFGRSPVFCLATVLSGDLVSFESVKNSAGDIPCSAGAVSAKVLADLGVDCVIAGGFGPQSCGVFRECGVVPYAASGCRISEALERYLAGDLPSYDYSAVAGDLSGRNNVSGFYFGRRGVKPTQRSHVCGRCGYIAGERMERGDKCPNCGFMSF